VKQILQPQDIKKDTFTHQEYQKVKKSIIEGNALGPDCIPPEMFKSGCGIDNVMLNLANKLLIGDKPDQWSETDMKPLPKSGDLGLTDNYRGIALSSVAAKIINKRLLK